MAAEIQLQGSDFPLLRQSTNSLNTHTKTTFIQVTSERDFPVGSITQLHTRNSKSSAGIFTTDAQNGCYETSVTLQEGSNKHRVFKKEWYGFKN
jgi:hypothetical protein